MGKYKKYAKKYIKKLGGYWPWLLLLCCVEGVAVLFLALADAEALKVLAGAGLLLTVILFGAVSWFVIQKEEKAEEAFREFLQRPDEQTENQLLLYCKSSEREQIRLLGEYLHGQQEEKERLLDRMADYEEYVEGWAHEVKTPLTLLTFLLGNHKEEMPENVGYKLEYIQTRMQESVDQMLFYARLKGGHKDYLFENLDLRESINKILEDYGPLLEEKKIQVVLTLRPEKISIYSDRRGFEFLLGQFMSNAVKYCEKQSRICFRAEKNKDIWLLTIEDTGCGVKACDLPFIFDKGFTGSDVNVSKKATGMGLYLAREMAADLGLTLHAMSTYGKGFTMEVKIPVVNLPYVQDPAHEVQLD